MILPINNLSQDLNHKVLIYRNPIQCYTESDFENNLGAAISFGVYWGFKVLFKVNDEYLDFEY